MFKIDYEHQMKSEWQRLKVLVTGCPLNNNQKNDKKMTNFLVKNEKKMKVSQKMSKKHYEAKLKIN